MSANFEYFMSTTVYNFEYITKQFIKNLKKKINNKKKSVRPMPVGNVSLSFPRKLSSLFFCT